MKKHIKKLALLTIALLTGAAASGKDIRIAYPNWAEGIAITHLAKVVIEDRLDYDVKLTKAQPGTIFAAVANGTQDIFLDAWLPNTHAPYWEKFGDKLVDVGPVFSYGVTGLVVPSYVKINSIDELNSIKDELDGKITGIGTGAGIFRNTKKVIEEYGLDLEQIASSGPAMTAALANAIENKEAIVVTGWKPHWKFGRYDLKVLKDPKGVYPIDGVKKILRKGFSEERPEVAQFITNMSLTESHLLEIMLAIDDDETNDTEAVVRDWAIANEPLIDSWIPM